MRKPSEGGVAVPAARVGLRHRGRRARPARPVGRLQPRRVPLQRDFRRVPRAAGRARLRGGLHQEIRTRVATSSPTSRTSSSARTIFLQGKFEDGVNDWARLRLTAPSACSASTTWRATWAGKAQRGLRPDPRPLGRAPGPYLMLPFLGSSTVRDAAGTAVDWAVQPVGEVRPIACATRSTACTSSTRARSCSTRAASSRRRRSTNTCSSAMLICNGAAA